MKLKLNLRQRLLIILAIVFVIIATIILWPNNSGDPNSRSNVNTSPTSVQTQEPVSPTISDQKPAETAPETPTEPITQQTTQPAQVQEQTPPFSAKQYALDQGEVEREANSFQFIINKCGPGASEEAIKLTFTDIKVDIPTYAQADRIVGQRGCELRFLPNL